MQNVTTEQLKYILEGRGTQTEVTIASATVPRMRKKNNPYFDRVKKHSIVVGDICFRYEDEVNKQRQREHTLNLVAGEPVEQEVTKFEALNRTWGEKEQTRERVGALVYHGQNAYLELKVAQSVRHEYRDLDGNLIDKENIKPFLYESKPSQRQGTDKEVIIRDYKLSNIVSILLDGRTYKV